MGEVAGVDARREQILRDALDLTFEDIVWLVERLLARVGGGLRVEPEMFERLRRRVDALAQLRRARSLLGLPSDAKVPVDGYRLMAVGHDLWHEQRVIRAFGPVRGWRIANNALLGQELLPSAIQRSRERGTMRRRTEEDQMEGLRIWLHERPGSRGPADCEAFVIEFNDDLDRQRDAEARRLVAADTIRAAFPGIPWEQIVAWAEAGHSTKRARTLARQWWSEQGVGDGLLVSRGELSTLVGCTPQNVDAVARDPRFPAVATVLSGVRVWLRADVVAFASSAPVPDRPDGFMAGMLVDVQGMAERLGVSDDAVRQRIHVEAWHLIPEPAGRAGRRPYWLVDEITRWQSERAA